MPTLSRALSSAIIRPRPTATHWNSRLSLLRLFTTTPNRPTNPSASPTTTQPKPTLPKTGTANLRSSILPCTTSPPSPIFPTLSKSKPLVPQTHKLDPTWLATDPITLFFHQYPSFNYDPLASYLSEFDRLGLYLGFIPQETSSGIWRVWTREWERRQLPDGTIETEMLGRSRRMVRVEREFWESVARAMRLDGFEGGLGRYVFWRVGLEGEAESPGVPRCAWQEFERGLKGLRVKGWRRKREISVCWVEEKGWEREAKERRGPQIWWHMAVEKKGEREDEGVRRGWVTKPEPVVVAKGPRLIRHFRKEPEDGAEMTADRGGVVPVSKLQPVSNNSVFQRHEVGLGMGKNTESASRAQLQGFSSRGYSTTSGGQGAKDNVEADSQEAGSKPVEVTQSDITEEVEANLSEAPAESTTTEQEPSPPKKGRRVTPEEVEKFARLRYEKADRKAPLTLSRASLTKTAHYDRLSKAQLARLDELENREAQRAAFFMAKIENEKKQAILNFKRAERERKRLRREGERNDGKGSKEKEEEIRKARKREKQLRKEEERREKKELGRLLSEE